MNLEDFFSGLDNLFAQKDLAAAEELKQKAVAAEKIAVTSTEFM